MVIPSSISRFQTVFQDGTSISFRLLTKSEYDSWAYSKQANQTEDQSFFEQIYNHCVDEQYKDLGGSVRAGVLYSIGQYIWYQSYNYDSIEQEIELERARYNPQDLYETMKLAILNAFPAYKFHELDMIDRLSLIKLFTRAEAMLQIKTSNNYKPLNTKKIKNTSANSNPNPVDFTAENKEIAKAGFQSPETYDGTHGGQNLLMLRQAQATRLERIRAAAAKGG
jgi:hypothetical protein